MPFGPVIWSGVSLMWNLSNLTPMSKSRLSLARHVSASATSVLMSGRLFQYAYGAPMKATVSPGLHGARPPVPPLIDPHNVLLVDESEHTSLEPSVFGAQSKPKKSGA